MSFKSFLSAVGHDAKAVFSYLGSAQGQATVATVEGGVTAVVSAVNPLAGAALASVEAVVNAALKQVVSAEAIAAAAEQQSGTGAQKAAAVVSALAPQVESVLVSLGVSKPSASQVQSVSQVIATSMANIMNALPAPAAK